jgi:hypothetical protein
MKMTDQQTAQGIERNVGTSLEAFFGTEDLDVAVFFLVPVEVLVVTF